MKVYKYQNTISLILLSSYLYLKIQCQVCKFDEYYSDNGDCQKCDSSCLTCYGGGQADCFVCLDYMHNSNCLEHCPANYFEDNQQYICVTCSIPFCKKCQSSELCEICEDNFALSPTKDSCAYQMRDRFNYAYFDIATNKIVEVEKCPQNMEVNKHQNICIHPKICSQENYIGEYNSNCFNADEEGIKVFFQAFYIYFYTKKEVYVFSSSDFGYLFYLQNLNGDKDIQTIQSVFNDIFIVYGTFILQYPLGLSNLSKTINVPKSVLNNQNTLIVENTSLQETKYWIITTSSSLQDNINYDYVITSIKYSFQIGQKIFSYYIIPEKLNLIIVTLLRVTVFSSFIESVNSIKYLDIGEDSQVNWIKSFSQPFQVDKDIESNIVILNGMSVFIFDSVQYNIVQVVIAYEYGFFLEENSILAIKDRDKLIFMNTQDLVKNCINDRQCIKNNSNLILYSLTLPDINVQQIVSSLNGDIYISQKNSFQMQILDKKFNLKSIYSQFYKPIKTMNAFSFSNYPGMLSRYLIITHDNNAKIFSKGNDPKNLFSFCNEKSIEVFNEEIEEFGAFGVDELRNILIYAAVSIQGNIVIYMKKNGQALFFKEMQGDSIIDRLTMVRSVFRIFINPEQRLIKLFGITNSQKKYLVVVIEYFNFKIVSNYEVYDSVDSIISNSVFLAKLQSSDNTCIFYFKLNHDKSQLVNCFTQNSQQIKDSQKYIAASFNSTDISKNYIQFYPKDNLAAIQVQRISATEFSFEFLDDSTVLVIISGKFFKFSVENVPIDVLKEYPNPISGLIKNYQIEENKTWMLISELRGSYEYYFHFINLQSDTLAQVDADIIPLTTQDDTSYNQYYGTSCSFLLIQSTFNKQSFFQIISSDQTSIFGQTTYRNTVVSYSVTSNSQFKLIGKKRIDQLSKAEDQKIIEGSYSQNMLLFYNQLNIKEQINVLCSYNCQNSGKIDKYQILYYRWFLPNVLKQFSTDRINLEDYYQNTMYSEKWRVLGLEAYQTTDKKPLDKRRIELIQYPEKYIIFSYKINVLCNLFTFQISSPYDVLLICDNMQILVFSLSNISQNYQAYLKNPSVPLNQVSPLYTFTIQYPSSTDQYAQFSTFDPIILLNLYGVYDYYRNIFYPQQKLLFYTKGKEGSQQIMENELNFYYLLNQFIYSYNKKRLVNEINDKTIGKSSLIFLNKKDQLPYLERDFIIGLTQLKDQQQVQIFDYNNLTPLKSFYELEMEQFNQQGYYFYCWQYQKLFLRYDSSILGYDFPFSATQNPFFKLKMKNSTPRACSNTYLVVYENQPELFKIRLIRYSDATVTKEISLYVSIQRIQIDLFLKQKNIAIIEDKQIIVIGNILFSTGESDFYFIFQESKFHYSPSLDVAFIHQQSLEKYIQVIDLSSLFPFILERFSFETNLNFQNYYYTNDNNQPIKPKNKKQVNFPNQPDPFPPLGLPPHTNDFSQQDLIFINLSLLSVCIYDTTSQIYSLLSLPVLEPNQNLEAKESQKVQYTIYLNQDVNNSKTFAVINMDRYFYLYTYKEYLKTLKLTQFQEIHVGSYNNQVFIYAFKDNELFYITIDNIQEDFVITKINLQNNFQNFLLIARGVNMQFALVDVNHNLIAQKSSSDKSCSAKLPDQFVGKVRGIQILQLQISNSSDNNILVFIWTNDVLSVFDIECKQLWLNTNLISGVTQILNDDDTQQIIFSDKYFIHVIRYIDIISLTNANNDFVIAKLPLQARGYIKFVKVNTNWLAVLSYSNVYIFQVKESFTSMFQITNKEFQYIKQIFIVLDEFFVIADINRLYIYQILSDKNNLETEQLIDSRNILSGSSSFSSTSSNNSSPFSNQGESSEYYISQQTQFRKYSVLFYTQTNLYLEILSVSTIEQDSAIFVRIIGADYNNLIDLVKQIKSKDLRVSLFNDKFRLRSDSEKSISGKSQANIEELFQQQSCRGDYVIHKKKDYQIIQYDTIYLQNEGLYNQITFKYPYVLDTLLLKDSSSSDLFIPNSLKLQTKIHSNFIYDLNGNIITIQPQTIKSSITRKLKIMNGIINKIKGAQPSRLLEEDMNQDQLSSSYSYSSLSSNNDYYKNYKKNGKTRNLQMSIIPNTIQQFEQIYLQNIELRQSLNIQNCDEVILENITIPNNDLRSQIDLNLVMPKSPLSTVTIFNMTVHAQLLTRQFLSIKNARSVNITNLTVIGEQNDKYYDFNIYSFYENQNWIQIISCGEVTLSNLNFTNTNLNIDIFFLQDIDTLKIQKFFMNNFNHQFYISLSQDQQIGDGIGRVVDLTINEKGEIVQNVQQNLQYYINLPLNTASFASVFRIIYIKDKMDINDITVINSSISTLLHFNKTIIQSSQVNKNIQEQFQSTSISITLKNINIDSLYSVSPLTCQNSDLIVIEGLFVTMTDIKIKEMNCYQSIFRCISCNSTQLTNINVIRSSSINFLLYFFQNKDLSVDNMTVENSSNLQSLIGIVNSKTAIVKNLKVFPYELLKSQSQEEEWDQILIRNSALFFYKSEDVGISMTDLQFTTPSEITLQDSFIQQYSSNSNGTAIQAYNVNIKLINVNLNNNKAQQNGGAIYLQSCSLTLQNTKIFKNEALLSGGGIYSSGSNIIISDINKDTSKQSQIFENNASIGGGIRYFKYNIDLLKFNREVISNNKAIFFGNDYTNYPGQLLLKNVPKDSNTISNVVSSISTVQQEISFYWLDEQNKQLIYESDKIDFSDPTYEVLEKELDQYITVQLVSSSILMNRVKNQVEMKGEIVKLSNGTQYVKTSQSLLLKPKEKGQLSIKTTIDYPEDEGKEFKQQSIAIDIYFRECLAGEVFNAFNQDIYECLECKDNTYSLIKPLSFETKCLICPDEAKECHKNVIQIYDEYWIEPNTSNIYYCYNSPEKCQPQQKNGCSEGGFGPRCESCDYIGDVLKDIQYAKYGRFKCQQCGEQRISQYVIVAILIIVFGVFQAYLALKVTLQTQTTLLGHYLKRAGIINLGLTIQGIRLNSLIKFVVGYFQIIQVLTSFNFQFSLSFLNTIYFFGNPLQISYFFLDCLYIKKGWIDDLEIVYIRLIWSIINTLIYVIISLILSISYVFYTKKKSSQKKTIIFRFARTALYYVFYLMFPSLTSQFINIISCEKIGTKKYIYADNQFLCNSNQHLLIGYPIAIPMLVLMLIVFPTYIYFQLKKNRNNLYHINFYLKYRFFFSEYKDSCYYWELVKMAQKGLIYIGLSLYNENQIAKGAIVSLIMTVYIRYLYILKPYKRIFLNQIEFAASFTLLICFQVGMINLTSSSFTVQMISFYLIVFSNAIFFVYFIFMILRDRISYNKRMPFYSCIQTVIKRFPSLNRIFHLSESIYLSHKGWAKVRNTIKRIGYQKLPLYFQNNTKNKDANNNNPSIIFQVGGQPVQNQISTIFSPKVKTLAIIQSTSQKCLTSENIAAKEVPNFQPQGILPIIHPTRNNIPKKSLHFPQPLLPKTQHDIDLGSINQYKQQQEEDDEDEVIDVQKADIELEQFSQSQSLSIKIPNENINASTFTGIIDINTLNDITTAQKILSTQDIKIQMPSSVFKKK